MDARELIAALGLAPHPEGGFYREVFRDAGGVVHPTKRERRSCVTCIYFLLERGSFSAFHRVAQTEIWHHLEGGPLELVTLGSDGRSATVVLGKDVGAGEAPVFAVPPHVWQAAAPKGDFTLASCTVAPGFEFADFEMPARAELLRSFPSQTDLVTRFTR